MKELIKKSWFVFLLGMLIAIVGLLLIGLILYCNGYRIVYPEQFETSWNAVSGVADWVGIIVSILSAIASFMAVWFAVRVADKQNKIALFEKRYKLYLIIQNLLLCATRIPDCTTNSTVYAVLKYYFREASGIETKADVNILDFIMLCYEIQDKLMSGSFLFSNYDINLLTKIIDRGKNLALQVYKTDSNSAKAKSEISESVIQLRNEYCKFCDEFDLTCFKTIKKELDLMH